MKATQAEGATWLVVRARQWLCALPLAEVEETLRPLPVVTLAGAPDFLRGMALVRGAPVPVVELGALLQGGAAWPGRRFVSLRLPGRRVALEVEEVLGLRWLNREQLQAAPPLVHATEGGGYLNVLGELDGNVLATLNTSRLLPPELWARLQGEG